MSDENYLFDRAILAAKKLLVICVDVATPSELADADESAFSRDKAFLEKAISAFTSADTEGINSIWCDVQHLSRFFGGDYVLFSKMRDDFERQCNELFDATLELVRSLRTR